MNEPVKKDGKGKTLRNLFRESKIKEKEEHILLVGNWLIPLLRGSAP